MSRKRLEREMLAVNIRNLSDEDDEVRLTAIEALVTSTWDPEWNPEGMIEEGGLPAVVHCLGDENPTYTQCSSVAPPGDRRTRGW